MLDKVICYNFLLLLFGILYPLEFIIGNLLPRRLVEVISSKLDGCIAEPPLTLFDGLMPLNVLFIQAI
jgi:hypothetical protein